MLRIFSYLNPNTLNSLSFDNAFEIFTREVKQWKNNMDEYSKDKSILDLGILKENFDLYKSEIKDAKSY